MQSGGQAGGKAGDMVARRHGGKVAVTLIAKCRHVGTAARRQIGGKAYGKVVAWRHGGVAAELAAKLQAKLAANPAAEPAAKPASDHQLVPYELGPPSSVDLSWRHGGTVAPQRRNSGGKVCGKVVAWRDLGGKAWRHGGMVARRQSGGKETLGPAAATAVAASLLDLRPDEGTHLPIDLHLRLVPCHLSDSAAPPRLIVRIPDPDLIPDVVTAAASLLLLFVALLISLLDLRPDEGAHLPVDLHLRLVSCDLSDSAAPPRLFVRIPHTDLIPNGVPAAAAAGD
eukprot:gene11535-biopygen7693